MAGFISERVAGFKLECLAGFVGIRTHLLLVIMQMADPVQRTVLSVLREAAADSPTGRLW